MKTSESLKNIGAALLQFNKAVDKISKSAENPFFKSSYAPLPEILEAIKNPLLDNGLVVMQFPKGQNELETLILHPESGEWMSESYFMKPAKEDPQGYGSVITYQRRYALGAILGLNIDEDDDGNKASQPVKKESEEKPWMMPKHRQMLLDKISNGEYYDWTPEGVLNEALKYYKIRKEWQDEIKAAMSAGHQRPPNIDSIEMVNRSIETIKNAKK